MYDGGGHARGIAKTRWQFGKFLGFPTVVGLRPLLGSVFFLGWNLSGSFLTLVSRVGHVMHFT